MKKNIPERLKIMRKEGYPVTLPHTERKIKLRAVEAKSLLLENKMPDLLTPLVIKAVYSDLTGDDMKNFLNKTGEEVKEALDFAESIDYICSLAIADDTPLEDLVSSEKRWVFRLVLGPAELLVTFREDEDADVGTVAEGERIQEPA